MTSILFDPELIKRYDKAGPRYTSYPTAVQFTETFDTETYRRIATQSNATHRPLSLYFHIPFCDTICYYCACNKIVTKNRRHADPYLANVHHEIALQAELFSDDRTVEQLHWGGGTPTFISHEQMQELMQVTRTHFNLLDDDSGEYSIEIDPREVTPESISLLREIGFNRMSLGVQDFNPDVQVAVNRIQSEEQTASAMHAARQEGFKSISLDLIYGLPHQTVDTFLETLHKVIALDPDRLSIFNYAHLPHLFKTQKQIDASTLPSPEEKLTILHLCIDTLTQAGYEYIGMDHFAKPQDELAIAQKNGTLYRNFQGYSTHATCDLIGLGITSIGNIGQSYAQNVKTLQAYDEVIKQNTLPILRGIELDADDVIRQDLITQLICHFQLDIPAFSARHQLQFGEYFATELAELASMQADGLVHVSNDMIQIQPVGKLLIRNICMVFDRYLRQEPPRQYSRVI